MEIKEAIPSLNLARAQRKWRKAIAKGAVVVGAGALAYLNSLSLTEGLFGKSAVLAITNAGLPLVRPNFERGVGIEWISDGRYTHKYLTTYDNALYFCSGCGRIYQHDGTYSGAYDQHLDPRRLCSWE